MTSIQNIITKHNIEMNNKLQPNSSINNSDINLSKELKEKNILPSEIINNNTSNNQENNNNNIINNSNSESINIFANNTEPIYIEDTELVPEYDLLFDEDEIYIRDLENNLLSKRDINDQSFKYIQDEVKNEVMRIIEVKKLGDSILKTKFDFNINYILDNKFNNIKWIIPVINDKQIYFTKLSEDEQEYIENSNENNNDEIFTSLKNERDPNGLKVMDQRIHLIKLTELESDFENGKYNLSEYLSKKNDLLKTYIKPDNKNGYDITSNQHFNALRYIDINTIHWEQRFVNEPLFTQIEIKDDKNKTKFIQKNLLVPGEKVNIIGFVILSNYQNNIFDIFDTSYRIGSLGFYGNIQEIIVGKNTKIIMNNHKLNTDDQIYLSNSNSIPEINGIFNITVISNNEFYINLDTTGGTNGTYADVYTNLKLNLKTYNINKKLEISPNFNKNDLSHAKLILFNSFNVSENNLKDILNKIIPSIDDILKDTYIVDKISKIQHIEQLYKIFKKYNIKFNDLTNHQYEFIKNIIGTNIPNNKIMSKNDIKSIYNKLNLKIKDDPLNNTIYSYENFNNEEIKKYYGEYPLYMSPNDTLANRILWVESHIDNGEIFYNIILRNINNTDKIYKNKSKDIKDINNILAKIKEPEGSNLLYNYKIRIIDIFDSIHNAPYNIAPPLPSDKILVNNILYNISYNDKKTSYIENTDEWEQGDKALYIQPLYSEEYIYDSKNKKWNFNKKLDPSYKRLFQFCSNNLIFNNNKCFSQNDFDLLIEIKDLNNLSILPDNINEKLNKLIEGYQKIIEFRKNNLKQIEDENKIKNDQESRIEDIALTVKRILDMINTIKNDEIKLYLINKLIIFDGITIHKKIYSKKYGSYLICGHYHYLIAINNTDNNEEKFNLNENMLTEYGDDGDNDTSNIYCKVCSTPIGILKGDDVVGFDTQGHAIRENDLLDSDIIKDQIYKETKKRNGEIIKGLKINDKSVISDFTSLNIKIDDITITIINSIDTLTMKIGIFLKREDYYQVIIDCYPFYNNLYNFNDYKRQQIKILKSKGQSDNAIKKLDDKKYFKDTYDRYINENKYSIVAARLLISYETSIVEYPKEKGNSNCIYDGYSTKDDKGINYFSCIINELDKNLKNANFSIRRNYDKFRRLRHINELFQIKFKSDILKRSSSKLDVFKNKDIDSLLDFSKIPNKNDIYSRYFFIARSIIKDINSIISKSILLDPLGFTANVCCDQTLDTFTNYYQFITNKVDNMNKYIQESNELENIMNETIFKGNISRLFLGGFRDTYTNLYIQLIKDSPNHNIILFKDLKFNPIDYSKITKKLDIDFVNNIINNYFKLLHKKLGRLINIEKINSTKDNILKIILVIKSNTIQNIKSLLNNYFRRFISIIKNHKNKAKDINRIVFTDSENSKILQEQIYNNNAFIEEFLNYSKEFQNIEFENTFTDIENINLDEFDLTIYLLNSILFTELNKFSTIGSINVNRFIINIFDKFIEDYNDLNMNDNEYNKIITTIKAKITKPEEVQQTVGEIDHKVSIYDDMSEEFEKEIKDNYKDEYLKKYGKLPTDDELELYKEDFEDQLIKDKDTYDEFYMKQPKEGNEVLEVGDDFGEMPQGTENEGDGVPDNIDNYDVPNYTEED